LSRPRRREQSASEEPILDSGELRAPLTLTELEPARWLERSEDVRVGIPLGQPRARRDGELGCEVAFSHCRESRRVEQARLRAAGGDRSWSGAYRSPTSGRPEALSHINRRRGDSTTGPKKPLERSQHGELLPQSTENVGEHDRIERTCPERLVGAGGRDDSRTILYALGPCALRGDLESLDRHVGADDRATSRLCEVQAGPAPTGADVEQSTTGAEVEQPTDLVGLLEGRVAIDAPHCADDPTLDVV